VHNKLSHYFQSTEDVVVVVVVIIIIIINTIRWLVTSTGRYVNVWEVTNKFDVQVTVHCDKFL